MRQMKGIDGYHRNAMNDAEAEAVIAELERVEKGFHEQGIEEERAEEDLNANDDYDIDCFLCGVVQKTDGKIDFLLLNSLYLGSISYLDCMKEFLFDLDELKEFRLTGTDLGLLCFEYLSDPDLCGPL